MSEVYDVITTFIAMKIQFLFDYGRKLLLSLDIFSLDIFQRWLLTHKPDGRHWEIKLDLLAQ